MNRKFISVFMIGAATLASLGTVTSCKDYDDDIDNLQERIDASGVDLKAEVSRLQGLLDNCKSACETADTELNEAIKNATNDAKGYADIQAAEAKKAAVEAAQKLIEDAISDLENGAVKAAQAKADEAYTLAEQVSKLAADNEANIKKLVGQLDEAKSNLEKADAELDKRLTEAEKKLADAQKLAAQNEADIIKTNKALESLKESNDKALKALNGKDDELKKLIDDNQTAIEKLLDEKVKALTGLTDANKAAIDALEKTVKANKDDADQAVKDAAEAAQKKLDDAVEKLEGTIKDLKDKDIKDLNDAIDAINGENGYKKLINDLKTGEIKDLQDNYDKLTAKDGPIEKNAAAIKDLNEKTIVGINSYLDILNANLNNLITSLILQDEQLEIVQALVVSDVNRTGLSKTFTEARNGKTYVWFPYKGADNASDVLIAGEWNVERAAGNVYYTINPTNVNFEDKANISVENSLAAVPEGIEISAPEASKRKSPITRAAAEEKAPANGLYQSAITNKNIHLDAKHPGFANSYALFTRYNQKGQNEKVTEKKVYSQYALNINVTDATEQNAPSIVAVGASAVHPATCDARFVVNYGEDLKGTFNLLPQNTEFGKSGATPKVYRKYVEAYAVSNSRNEAQTGATLTSLIKAINKANAGVLNTIFEEDNAGFDQISVTIPDAEGNYSFVGSTVTFRYFIQNYNGTIYSKDIKVMFTKTLFKEDGMDIEHTPYASGVNDTKHGLNKDSKTDFQLEANCIKVAASNALWYKNTAKIEVKATDGLKVKTIDFFSDDKTPTAWTSEAALASINMNETASGTVSGLAQATVKKIKNMTITYDPAKVEVEKEYNLVMTSYDLNDNPVSELKIKFTMKYPNHHAGLIKPNPAFFTPYEKDMKTAEGLAGKTLTAWANKHKDVSPAAAPGTVYDATYNIIAAFNDPYNDADGCVISFDYTDKNDYIQANGKYKAFKPVNDWRLNFASAETDYTMEVPSAAVAYDKEHAYTLQVAVENYGVESLWYNPVAFTVVFKSAIAHANFKFEKSLYEVEYPSKEITLGDADITSDDPSTSVVDDIKYFGAQRDERIKATSVKLLDSQFASLFKTVEITDNGIHIVTNETVPGGVGSITTDAVSFGFYVTDFYGNTREYKFNVKVKENK